ncbi:MAG TPA: hypothetical protein VFN96_07415, partial [Gemmatimonadales bacterium]|nr:hypothetical protein [Gemmatimonadales bacterium]
LTTTQLFDEAIKRFDSLVVYPGTNNTIRRAALVGKARALLNLDQAAAAGALVDSLPANWTYLTTHTVALGRQQNGIFVFINQNERWSVANVDGGNGLDFRGGSDPRVPWHRFGTDVGFDATTPQYDQGKYASETASVVISGGVEARLIAAEAALQAGDNPTWLGILNALRADPTLVPSTFPAGFPPAFPALGALADPGSATAREDLMFRELAFWLYLTGHRLGDLRRLVRQYGRIGTAAGGVFPGAGGAQYVIDGNPKGGIFGDEMNLPVPFDETNNPQFLTCIDRNP